MNERGRCGVRAVVLSVVAFAVVMGSAVSSQTPGPRSNGMPDGREFVVHVTPAVSMSTCHVSSFQTGPFGGIGRFSVNGPGDGVFGIRTGVGGQPAATLKIAMWCRGYAMATLNIASLPSSTFEAAVSLTPLAGQPMTGRVLPSPDGASMAGGTLRVFYTAPFLCAFFGLPDCGIPQWEVAVGKVDGDGTFRVLVPDFARDPAVKTSEPGWGSGNPGWFNLRVDREVEPHNYWLEPDGASPPTWIPVAATYPELALRPRRH
jgi:hypothetical protein